MHRIVAPAHCPHSIIISASDGIDPGLEPQSARAIDIHTAGYFLTLTGTCG